MKIKTRLRRLWSIKRIRRYARRRPITTTLLAVGLILVGGLLIAERPLPTVIDPAAYKPVLDVIAQGESSGNYNAYYGHADNSELRFTDMTVSQVLQWQEDYVNQGMPSSAVGRYQIIRPTLVKLITQLNIDSSAHFDAQLQDRMAIALLERRGSIAYVEDKLSTDQFAANLAQEWAALPKMTGSNPQESYHAGDGLNASRVSIDAIRTAISAIQPVASNNR